MITSGGPKHDYGKPPAGLRHDECRRREVMLFKGTTKVRSERCSCERADNAQHKSRGLLTERTSVSVGNCINRVNTVNRRSTVCDQPIFYGFRQCGSTRGRTSTGLTSTPCEREHRVWHGATDPVCLVIRRTMEPAPPGLGRFAASLSSEAAAEE